MMPLLLMAAAPCKSAMISFLPTWYEFLPADPSDTSRPCAVAFAFPDDIGRIALAAVDILLRVAAIVAVGYIIYGGFQYILTRGEPEKISNSRKTITNAVIGLVITMVATGIVTLIGNAFYK
jgi:hypothetical protein